MAKFLDAAAAAFHLEELITTARERLILVTPSLKFSGRAKDLVGAKHDLDLHIVYGRCDLPPDEINWLRSLPFLRTHFCRSVTAKLYLSEQLCIISSLDLFDFGQVMNEEAGVLASRSADPELYARAAEEAERIVTASTEVRIRVDKVECVALNGASAHENGARASKLSTHRLAKKLGLRTQELLDGLERLGAIEIAAGQKQLTERGLMLGGEFRSSARFGNYFVWPENFELSEIASVAERV
jgi:hypothetical protein